MLYTIQELSNLAGVSKRTLRYYDEIGLLVAKRRKDSSYRVYETSDVDILHYILILKEMGFGLDQIKVILEKSSSEHMINIFEKHVIELYQRQEKTQKMIHNVKQTIASLKGEAQMNNQEKFEGYKEVLLIENDQKYKNEVIDRWGNQAYETSRKTFSRMTKDELDAFNQLAGDIIQCLHDLKNDIHNHSKRYELFSKHKSWLTQAWGGIYQKDAHRQIVMMYVEDERFKTYYDQHGEGFAEILRDCVLEFA
ncbi:MAG TPA: MerR family transcriptional regulator [Acholeplasmataceae bacterium]|nr:MerR family transcriptional regulator [Acholeplasmataceae bacterium]HRX44780.1 MerR family transcriptional regulator [Acholeplasmataceae bacterium]